VIFAKGLRQSRLAGAKLPMPCKMLVWEDGSGQTWLGYNDPTSLAGRHGVSQCAAAANLKQALTGFAQAIVAK